MTKDKAKGVSFQQVSKNFGKVFAVKDLDLEAEAGKRLVLLGPSGCGKTTVLRLVAGLEKPTSGHIYLGNELANDLPPGVRGVAMVFQDYALYPHMTVWNNLAFGLKLRRLPTSQVESRINRALEMLEIGHLRSRRPHELSGGQRQRVALARAVVKEAPIFLLDEPLSNLDAQFRARARKDLVRLHQEIGSTMIYVTHDQVEAMAIGEMVAVLMNGMLQQVDTPEGIYCRPASTLVARFIGSPPMNLLSTKVDAGTLLLGNVALRLPEEWRPLLFNHRQYEVVMGIRPEDVILQPVSSFRDGALPVQVKWREHIGGEFIFHLTAGADIELAARTSPEHPAQAEETWWAVLWDWRHVHFFDRNTGMSLGYPVYCNALIRRESYA